MWTQSKLIEYLVKFVDENKVSLELRKNHYENIPKKVYKFRKFNKDNLQALRDDYIWLSLAKDFTDQTDSTIDFNFKNQQKKIGKLIEKELPLLIF